MEVGGSKLTSVLPSPWFSKRYAKASSEKSPLGNDGATWRSRPFAETSHSKTVVSIVGNRRDDVALAP